MLRVERTRTAGPARPRRPPSPARCTVSSRGTSSVTATMTAFRPSSSVGLTRARPRRTESRDRSRARARRPLRSGPRTISATTSRGGCAPFSRADRSHLDRRHPAGDDAREVRQRSGATFRANPCVVRQRERWTPIEAILRGPTQTPMRSPSPPSAAMAKSASVQDEYPLQVAHVSPDVSPVRTEVENRVADELTRAMKGHLSAAVCGSALRHLARRAPRGPRAHRLRWRCGPANRRAGAPAAGAAPAPRRAATALAARPAALPWDHKGPARGSSRPSCVPPRVAFYGASRFRQC